LAESKEKCFPETFASKIKGTSPETEAPTQVETSEREMLTAVGLAVCNLLSQVRLTQRQLN
jgi:hypothetical protein